MNVIYNHLQILIWQALVGHRTAWSNIWLFHWDSLCSILAASWGVTRWTKGWLKIQIALSHIKLASQIFALRPLRIISGWPKMIWKLWSHVIPKSTDQTKLIFHSISTCIVNFPAVCYSNYHTEIEMCQLNRLTTVWCWQCHLSHEYFPKWHVSNGWIDQNNLRGVDN